MKYADTMRFLRSLRVPEGPKAGQPLRLAPFQSTFMKGGLAAGVSIAALSMARGNAKTALLGGVALGDLIGECGDRQPRREILLAGRTREQARVAFEFVVGFSAFLPDETRRRLRIRRSPRLEIEFEDEAGGRHYLRALSADGKNALGSAPSLVLMDERGHWPLDRGDELEAALLSGLGKRGGRAFIISTSAADDSHPFSRWLDSPPPGTYALEFRPPPGLPADDRESLALANPGARHGIGAGLPWLEAEARRAIARGGSALTAFRLYNRNERVSGESRDVLLTLDQWLSCETAELPPRSGPVVLGVDLGGSASMSAAAAYWFETGRLEAFGAFPGSPSLADRGAADAVGGRYVEMSRRGELVTLGGKVVPAGEFIARAVGMLDGQAIAALVADRYRQAEMLEAIAAAGVRAPMVWRGQGFRDGGEDCERFRRAVFEGRVRCAESLLMRSALADAVCLRDPANNLKLAKARSTGRIDAAAAAVLAVAEGARQAARPVRQGGGLRWAW